MIPSFRSGLQRVMKAIVEPINIETMVLVALWNNPAIFQGVFKISAQFGAQEAVFLFFRCEYKTGQEQHAVAEAFEVNDYQFSHLYNETQPVYLDKSKEGADYAEYVLKYALHKTLLEMRLSQKRRFAAIDDKAMQAIIKRVEPMLQQEGAWALADEDIGFSVAMDFYPQEMMGQLAVKTLMSLGCSAHEGSKIH